MDMQKQLDEFEGKIDSILQEWWDGAIEKIIAAGADWKQVITYDGKSYIFHFASTRFSCTSMNYPDRQWAYLYNAPPHFTANLKGILSAVETQIQPDNDPSRQQALRFLESLAMDKGMILEMPAGGQVIGIEYYYNAEHWQFYVRHDGLYTTYLYTWPFNAEKHENNELIAEHIDLLEEYAGKPENWFMVDDEKFESAESRIGGLCIKSKKSCNSATINGINVIFQGNNVLIDRWNMFCRYDTPSKAHKRFVIENCEEICAYISRCRERKKELATAGALMNPNSKAVKDARALLRDTSDVCSRRSLMLDVPNSFLITVDGVRILVSKHWGDIELKIGGEDGQYANWPFGNPDTWAADQELLSVWPQVAEDLKRQVGDLNRQIDEANSSLIKKLKEDFAEELVTHTLTN